MILKTLLLVESQLLKELLEWKKAIKYRLKLIKWV